jgi:beta-lactamase class A
MRVDIDERGVGQMADARNRSTPAAAADSLQKLWRNQLLSRASTQQLLNLMFAQTQPSRLRSGIPAEVRLADKCGTSDPVSGAVAAFNDIGIMVWPDGRSVIVAAFLTASTATDAQREELFANIAHEVTEKLARDARP